MTRNYKSSYKYFLFFLLFNCIGSAFAYSDEFNAYFICHPHPEGINFGLAFEDGEVTQLGIDNFNFIVVDTADAAKAGDVKLADDVTPEKAKRAQHTPPIKRADAALSILIVCSRAIAKYPRQNTISIIVVIVIIFIFEGKLLLMEMQNQNYVS